MPFRRRREGKTNYGRRLAFVKSGLPRLCVRRSNRYILAQLIKFRVDGDVVLAQAWSKQLKAFGWPPGKNLPSAYLTGLLLGVRTRKLNVGEAVLDIGFSTPVHGSRPFAVLKGALDGGLRVRFDEAALPGEERVSGKHVEGFARSLSEEQLGKKFSKYLEQSINVVGFSKLFFEVRDKILKEGGEA